MVVEAKTYQAPEITVEAFQAFSRKVAKRQYDEAIHQCAQLLYGFEAMGTRTTIVGGEDRSRSVLTMFASSITALLTDPDLILNRQGLGALLSLKTVLNRVFASTDFNDMSHVYGLLGEVNNGQMQLEEGETAKYLVVTTIDLATESTFQILETLDQDSKVLFWLSLLDTQSALNPTVHAYIGRLIKMTSQLKVTAMQSMSELDMVNRVWFNCSYWDFDDKHKVKKYLNEIFRKTASVAGVKEPKYFPPLQRERKPRLLIPIELWKVGSAMYRCYGKAVEKLSSRFHVIGLAQPGQIDDQNIGAFDETLELKTLPLENVKMVLASKPDIIFYPSVGMIPTITHLAQLRLAPVQCMSLGHPASSFSKAMDYVLVEEDWHASEACFAETIICIESGSFKLARPLVNSTIEPVILDPEKFHVVVNSMYQKLMPGFIDACAEIAQGSTKNVQFHFLCGATPINIIGISTLIQEKLDATCYPMMAYSEYFSILQSCDLQLSPFPFGNTNGFIDAMLAEVPTVCLQGQEVFSRTDAIVSNRLQLPAISRADSAQAYIDTSIEFIANDNLRAQFREAIKSSDIDERLFNDAEESDGDLSDALYWALENHRKIDKSKVKFWTVEARMLGFES